MNTEHITVGGFTMPVDLPTSRAREHVPVAGTDPGGLIGQRVRISRQPAPNRFGRPHPLQTLTGVLTAARRVNHSDWTLVLDSRSSIAFGSDGGYFTTWHIESAEEDT